MIHTTKILQQGSQKELTNIDTYSTDRKNLLLTIILTQKNKNMKQIQFFFSLLIALSVFINARAQTQFCQVHSNGGSIQTFYVGDMNGRSAPICTCNNQNQSWGGYSNYNDYAVNSPVIQQIPINGGVNLGWNNQNQGNINSQNQGWNNQIQGNVYSQNQGWNNQNQGINYSQNQGWNNQNQGNIYPQNQGWNSQNLENNYSQDILRRVNQGQGYNNNNYNNQLYNIKYKRLKNGKVVKVIYDALGNILSQYFNE